MNLNGTVLWLCAKGASSVLDGNYIAPKPGAPERGGAICMVTDEIPLTETVFYILLVLGEPRHGYGIVQEVKNLTKGRVVLGAGTLYGALKALNAKHWIRMVGAASGPRGKKEYELTDEGRRVLRLETARLREALQNAEKLEDKS